MKAPGSIGPRHQKVDNACSPHRSATPIQLAPIQSRLRALLTCEMSDTFLRSSGSSTTARFCSSVLRLRFPSTLGLVLKGSAAWGGGGGWGGGGVGGRERCWHAGMGCSRVCRGEHGAGSRLGVEGRGFTTGAWATGQPRLARPQRLAGPFQPSHPSGLPAATWGP